MLREHHLRCKINTFAFLIISPRRTTEKKKKKNSDFEWKVGSKVCRFFSFGLLYVGSQGKSIEYAKIKSCYANNIGKTSTPAKWLRGAAWKFPSKSHISSIFISKLKRKMFWKKSVMNMIPWCLYLPWRNRIIGLPSFFLLNCKFGPQRQLSNIITTGT